MVKKIVILFLLIGLFSINYTPAEEWSPEHTLYTLDDFQHLPSEFLAIVNIIRSYKPNYIRGEIIDFIKTAYYTLRMQGIQISIYEVAEGIRRFSIDNLGIDLKDLVRAYVDSQSR